MLDLNTLTPEQYRTRYLALQEAARQRAATALPLSVTAPPPLEHPRKTETVPPGAYVALRLKRFDVLRITNDSGTPGAALFLWNADDVSERYNAGDTVKLQWTTNLTTGRVLFSDMGRVLASITADTSAGHDSIIGPNGPAQAGAGANGRDNLRLAGAKFGLTRRDLGPAVSLFSKIATDEAGRFHFQAAPTPGAMVELRAEQNLLVALSNTPHALSPTAAATGPISIAIAHRPPAADDLCRHFTEEAIRGFINTDEVFS
jgi:urea carboxylase-associated protein 2